MLEASPISGKHKTLHVVVQTWCRIVVVLVAKFQEKYHVVAGKISPKLLVRAQNPGRYNPNASSLPSKAYNNTPAAATPTSWHGNNNSPPSDHSSEDYEEVNASLSPHATNSPKVWSSGEKDVLYHSILLTCSILFCDSK